MAWEFIRSFLAGEMDQMLSHLGVEPLWKGGRVKGYRVLTLEELGRPRIDVTVRASGITRDCFYNCIELLDQAIREVAALDEPEDMNFLASTPRRAAASPASLPAAREPTATE